jgi:hypothetical protein
VHTLGIEAATVLYFLAGGGGTFLRVLVSPVLPSWGKRMVSETVAGAVLGILVPSFLGAILPAGLVSPEQLAAAPPILKAAGVFFAAYTGSASVGEVQGWLQRKTPKDPPA